MPNDHSKLRSILRSYPIEDLKQIIEIHILQLLLHPMPPPVAAIVEAGKIYLGILKTRCPEINSIKIFQGISHLHQNWLMNFLVYPALQRYAFKLDNTNDAADKSEIEKCKKIDDRMFSSFRELKAIFEPPVTKQSKETTYTDNENSFKNTIISIISPTYTKVENLHQQFKTITTNDRKKIMNFKKEYLATLMEFQDKFIEYYIKHHDDRFLSWVNFANALINEFKEAIVYEIADEILELVTPEVLQGKKQFIEKELNTLKSFIDKGKRGASEATNHMVQLIANIIENDDLGTFCALVLRIYQIHQSALSDLRRVSYVHNSIAQPEEITSYCGDGDPSDYPPYQLVLPLSILEKPYQEISAGDFHGNFECAMETLELFFKSQKNTYLTIRGDLIDRDTDQQYTNSLRILIAVFLTKALYPNRVFYVPGNHELELNFLDDGKNNFYRRAIKGSPISYNENVLGIPRRLPHDYYLPVFPIFSACNDPDKALQIQKLIHTVFLTAPIEIRIPNSRKRDGTVMYSCTSHSTPCLPPPTDSDYYDSGVLMEDYLDRVNITWSDWGGEFCGISWAANLLESDYNPIRERGGIAGNNTAMLLCTRCNVNRQNIGHCHTTLVKSIPVGNDVLIIDYLSSFYPDECFELQNEFIPQIMKKSYQAGELKTEYIILPQNLPAKPFAQIEEATETVEIYLKTARTIKQLTEMYKWVLRSQLLAMTMTMTINKEAKSNMDACLKSLIQVFRYYANIARDNFSHPLDLSYATLNENCNSDQYRDILQNEQIKTAFIDFLNQMPQLLKSGKNQIRYEMFKLRQYVKHTIVMGVDKETKIMIEHLQYQLELEENISPFQYENLISEIKQRIPSQNIAVSEEQEHRCLGLGHSQ